MGKGAGTTDRQAAALSLPGGSAEPASHQPSAEEILTRACTGPGREFIDWAITPRRYAETYGLSLQQAQEELDLLVEEGFATKKPYPASHGLYRPTEKAFEYLAGHATQQLSPAAWVLLQHYAAWRQEHDDSLIFLYPVYTLDEWVELTGLPRKQVAEAVRQLYDRCLFTKSSNGRTKCLSEFGAYLVRLLS